jgi:hypothetical protein
VVRIHCDNLPYGWVGVLEHAGRTVGICEDDRAASRSPRTLRDAVSLRLFMLPGKSIPHDVLLEAYFEPNWSSVHPPVSHDVPDATGEDDASE